MFDNWVANNEFFKSVTQNDYAALHQLCIDFQTTKQSLLMFTDSIMSE